MIALDTNVLVRYIVQDQQAEPTWTFDRAAAAAPGFRLLA
jgi:predicted nucleic-acid-binding protein